jgi:tetratricopeptide (TPR) repeat protein
MKKIIYSLLLTVYGMKDNGGKYCNKFFGVNYKLFLVITLIIFNFNYLYSAYSGGQPAEFLQFGASAKAMAMKSVYSISNDATAVYYNPAGLVQCDRKEVIALHTELFPNTQTIYDYIGFVYPTVKYGVFSVALNQLLSSGFEKIEIEYDPLSRDIIKIENKGTFEDRQIAFLVGYGKEVMEHVNVGVAMKYISRKLDVVSDTMIGFDISVLVIGVNYRFPKLNLAAGVKNLVKTKMDTEDELPIIFKLGGSYKFLRDRLTVGLDIEQNINAEMKWMIGTEYWLLDFLAIRIGFEGLSYLKETTAGIGGRYQDYVFDYSFAYHELGFSHRISAGMKWGNSVKFNKEEEIKKLLNEAIALYSAGKFIEAAKRVDLAYQINPNRKDLKNMLDNLLLVTAYINNATEDTEEHQGIRKAVSSLIEKDLVGAVNALRYAYYKNPENKKVHELLNRLEQMAGLNLTEQYKEDISGWTIIDKKIYEAREDILNGRYTDAIRRAQEILNLEPKNITALEIMGSAFFMMNEPEKAKKVWNKALELDPSNKVIRQFLQELE